MKKNITLAFVALLALSWYTSVNSYVGTPKEYEEHLEKAAAYEKKEIYEDAIEEYEEAQDYLKERDKSIDLKIAADYLAMEEESDYVDKMEEIISHYEDNGDAVLGLAEYYINDGKMPKAVALLKKQMDKETEDEKIIAKYEELKGTYTSVYSTYVEMSRVCNGYVIVKSESGYGVNDSNGQAMIDSIYEQVGIFDEELVYAPLYADGKWAYVNEDIHKKLVPDEVCEYLGTFSEGYAVAKKDGKYGYYDDEMELVCDFIYEDASVFANDVAAVKKDGKWAIIDDDFENITEFKYDDVAMDEFGYCSLNERIFVKSGDTYQMIDLEGNVISEQKFEDAYPFLEEGQPAAVKQNGKWGFVDSDGKICIECTYSEAKSFTIDFAPVKINEEWGYIDNKNNLVIPCEFTDATSFSTDGTASVQYSDVWSMIKLNIYQE